MGLQVLQAEPGAGTTLAHHRSCPKEMGFPMSREEAIGGSKSAAPSTRVSVLGLRGCVD